MIFSPPSLPLTDAALMSSSVFLTTLITSSPCSSPNRSSWSKDLSSATPAPGIAEA